MIEVKLWKKKANEVTDIVQSLRKQGMVQGVDFDFSFNPGGISERYENDTFDFTIRHTVFSFYTEKHASMFILQYSNYIIKR
jgi:hypothetical protein